MKLNQAPTFRVEDFPTEQSWIGRLFTQLNPFIASVSQTFDGNIDFMTNIKSITSDYTIDGFQAFSLRWPYKNSAPTELRVTKAAKGSQLTPTVLVIVWTYDAAQSVINVTDMFELTNAGVNSLSGRYTFTLRAII